MIDILICGYGNIGRHVEQELLPAKNNINIYIYDKYKTENNTGDPHKRYDISFVCVPTEKLQDGSADISMVKECVDNLIDTTTIVIKSAVPVGTCESLDQPNIIISPEYYGTTQHSLESPEFLVLGGNKEHQNNVAQLYYRIKSGNFKIIYTDWKTAELAKYMENCWIAAKVTFCNEFSDIAHSYGINYEELRQIFISDIRVNPSHTFVYEDKPYYDSHCLNKDIPALLFQCADNQISTPLMKSIDTININKKNQSALY